MSSCSSDLQRPLVSYLQASSDCQISLTLGLSQQQKQVQGVLCALAQLPLTSVLSSVHAVLSNLTLPGPSVPCVRAPAGAPLWPSRQHQHNTAQPGRILCRLRSLSHKNTGCLGSTAARTYSCTVPWRSHHPDHHNCTIVSCRSRAQQMTKDGLRIRCRSVSTLS